MAETVRLVDSSSDHRLGIKDADAPLGLPGSPSVTGMDEEIQDTARYLLKTVGLAEKFVWGFP